MIVDRNPTYQQLRARTRLGAFTVAQCVQLTLSILAAIGAGVMLVRLGAPAGPALTLGVLIAGAPVMASLVFEGHEFDALSLLLTTARWITTPRQFGAGAGAAIAGYLVITAPQPTTSAKDREPLE